MEPCVRGKSSQFPEAGTDNIDAVLLMTGVRLEARLQAFPALQTFDNRSRLESVACRARGRLPTGWAGGRGAVYADWAEKGSNAKRRQGGCRRYGG